MKHARQKIREAAAAILVAAIPGVVVSRSNQGKVMAHPHIDVYIQSEQSEMANNTIGAPRNYLRTASLVVAASIKASESADDEVDDIAAQIEAAMAADLSLGDTCQDIELYSTIIEQETRAEVLYARAELSYRVWYYTTALNPEDSIT